MERHIDGYFVVLVRILVWSDVSLKLNDIQRQRCHCNMAVLYCARLFETYSPQKASR